VKLAILTPFTSKVLSPWIPEVSKPGIPKGMGGPGNFELVKSLILNNHEIHLITLEPGINRPFSYHNINVNYYVTPMRLKGASRTFWNEERQIIVSYLKRINPHVVHAHWTYEYALAALEFNKYITLITARDNPYDVLKYSKNFLYLPQFLSSHYVYRKAKWLSCVSPSVLNYAKKFTNQKTKLFVVPNIMPKKNRLNLTDQINLPRPYIVSLASWGHLKNIKNGIRGFQKFRNMGNESFHYVLLGGGLNENDPSHYWAVKNDLATNVHFCGRQLYPKTLKILSNAFMLLHPSRTEACSMAIGEAMQLGIPVIGGKNSGGIPWQLENGESGCLVDIEYPEDIAFGIKALVHNQNYRMAIVANALERAQKSFSVDYVTTKYEEIYRQILNHN